MSPPHQQLIDYLEAIAPPAYQADYDNSGLQVGDLSRPTQGVLIALDPTEEVLQEAVDKNCNLIITHHPLIFRPIKQITSSPPTHLLFYAIEKRLSLYTIHTNLDYIPTGINQTLAKRLNIENPRILAPLEATRNVGAGMVGTLPEPLQAKDFISYVKSKLQLHHLRYNESPRATIQRVAFCGGSGASLLPHALRVRADAFITADVKYHTYFDSLGHLMLMDIGHYESEIGFKDLIYNLFSEKFDNIVLHKCITYTNPLRYD